LTPESELAVTRQVGSGDVTEFLTLVEGTSTTTLCPLLAESTLAGGSPPGAAPKKPLSAQEASSWAKCRRTRFTTLQGEPKAPSWLREQGLPVRRRPQG
jgi:hypothetical protein